MFNADKIARLNLKIEKLEEEKGDLKTKHFKELEAVKNEYEEKLKKVKVDGDDKLARLEANHDVRTQEAIAEVKKENSQLTIDKAILQKEVAMYEKAFENLGFDVKDMKEILNKLVDGLVSKNQIQLVK